MNLNLANQPFVNSRPVRRLVLVLWCLGALVAAADLILYARHFSGQQARRDRLAELTAQETAERERLAELERELAGFDLDWQNRQVEFLNLRIAERVFPWSRLFDRLASVLPAEVRLTRLRPEVHGLAGVPEGADETVQLEIRAEAQNEEAMLGFINRLFRHPAFRDPDLASENRQGKANLVDFALTVTYLPRWRPTAPGREPGAEPAAEGVEGGAGGEP